MHEITLTSFWHLLVVLALRSALLSYAAYSTAVWPNQGLQKIAKIWRFDFFPLSFNQKQSHFGPIASCKFKQHDCMRMLMFAIGRFLWKVLVSFWACVASKNQLGCRRQISVFVFPAWIKCTVPLCMFFPLSPLLLISNPNEYYWISHLFQLIWKSRRKIKYLTNHIALKSC